MPEPPLAFMVKREGRKWYWEAVTPDLVETAIDMGWELVIRSSDFPPSPHDPIEPSQSNPNRTGDEGGD